MPPKKRPARPRTRGGFPCPDCDFVAKHAMGLGRHRTTRHGVVSQRAARRGARGGLMSREQAAAYAGVHYNTIRHWERSGALRASKRAGVRGTLIDTADLNRLLADRAGPTGAPGGGGVDAAALHALEQRFRDLIEGLERLVATVKAPAPRAKATAPAKRAPKTRATPNTRAPKKRATAKKRAPKKRATAKKRTPATRRATPKKRTGKGARRR